MDYDLIIVGGGTAGASLAAAVRGASVALVASERRGEAHLAAERAFDARVYAISPGNVAFLRALGAWRAIPEARLAPVHAMHVYGDDGASCLQFDAYRAGVPELAWIVEDGALQDALWRSLEARDGLEVFAPAECQRLEIGARAATLTLRDGRSLAAQLVVGADGARSFVRSQAGIAAAERAYGQTALVANFACERAHRNVALQWFQGGPVLALLPLPGERVSMVWSLPDAEARRVLDLREELLCKEVESASHGLLGALAVITPPRAYALQRVSARRLAAPRVALVGDAAHVIHPLAGQGANLGLQDARELAAVLAARAPARDPGETRLLRRYERARAEPILSMDATVDGLYRLFGAEGRTLSRLRNFGLNFADRLPVVKNALIRHAMG